MINSPTKLLRYKDVLSAIKGYENHLLLGNGFNYGLGVNTSYFEIFQKMLEDIKEIYRDAAHLVEKSGYDLEIFIGILLDNIASNNIFLRKYVGNKVKFDFMKATHDIVKKNIKNVYAEKNEGIYLLLQNFSRFYTLNFDSFLYLLLLQFKSTNPDSTSTNLSFQSSIKFIENDFNEIHNNIYTEIRSLRNTGQLEIRLITENDNVVKDFISLNKIPLTLLIQEYSETKKKGWKKKDIIKVVKRILEEEKKNNVLKHIDDGAQLQMFGDKKEYVFNSENKTQNLFFLHGAFHICSDNGVVKKITQQSDKALYEKLEAILNDEEQDIVCVFQSNDKLEIIQKNPYLINCLNSLATLEGTLVIIGCSLSENDNHIFEQINCSKLSDIYISTRRNSLERTQKIAERIFANKSIHFFDSESISYELPDIPSTK